MSFPSSPKATTKEVRLVNNTTRNQTNHRNVVMMIGIRWFLDYVRFVCLTFFSCWLVRFFVIPLIVVRLVWLRYVSLETMTWCIAITTVIIPTFHCFGMVRIVRRMERDGSIVPLFVIATKGHFWPWWLLFPIYIATSNLCDTWFPPSGNVGFRYKLPFDYAQRKHFEYELQSTENGRSIKR